MIILLYGTSSSGKTSIINEFPEDYSRIIADNYFKYKHTALVNTYYDNEARYKIGEDTIRKNGRRRKGEH